jgi:hypothetical protein
MPNNDMNEVFTGTCPTCGQEDMTARRAEIEKEASKAAAATNGPSKQPWRDGYEEGVRAALDWVLGKVDAAPLEGYPA